MDNDDVMKRAIQENEHLNNSFQAHSDANRTNQNSPNTATGFNAAEEQDLDEMVHQPLADDEGGSLPDSESLSINEDEEYDNDLRNK